MLIDDVTITATAGAGGDGVVRFSKTLMVNGPTGGDGGHGGDVVLEAVSDLGALRPFRHKKSVKAERGQHGGQNTKHGADGQDIVVPVPVGTVATDLTHDVVYDLSRVGMRETIAKGGNGGFGNHHFRSSRNTTPRKANPGKPGEEIELRLELKMIADIGFVGKPNVGKSTLLNELTNASSKVANYHFTTLEPHLGVYYDLILADIPGLIEGAAEGKGLGHKFLRHIERTRVLFHFVAADSEDPLADYVEIRTELEAFSSILKEKDEWILVSRADQVSPEKLADVVKDLEQKNAQILTLSILDDAMMTGIKATLNKIADTKKV